MELSRKTDLALRILDVLDGGVRGADSLAETAGTTTGYLPHVMAPLIREGWVSSVRGPNGGYRLEVAIDSLSMHDVVVAIEGPLEDAGCVLRGGPCGGEELCPLHPAWTKVRQAIERELDRLPVSGLAGGTAQ